MRHILFSSTLVFLLAGCATTSFGPPPVALTYTGDTGTGATCPAGGTRRATVPVTRDVSGAYRLIDTFIEAYRCSAHSAANGRQAFEIPAFVSTAGAALASALGGGATYGIIGTGANSAFTAGNKYWDPKLKASIYDHALDALLCVKTEAVGIAAYKFDNAATENKLMAAFAGSGSKISVPVAQQYFEMVSSAAFSVERILSQRLSNMAPVDAAAVAAQLEKAIEEVRAKEKERAAAANAGAPTGTETDTGAESDEADALEDAADTLENAGDIPGGRQLLKGFWSRRFAESPNQTMVELDLAVLKPKLDECVIRAKL